MRWDIGAVYKEIRKSKGLSQKQVAGELISRQSLISFEKGESTPRYETMEYLLRQIDMSFAEFEYICNYYQPSKRQEIFNDFFHLIHSNNPKDFETILNKCHVYLKNNHDIPVQRLESLINIVAHIKENGIHHIKSDIQQLTQDLWEELASQDIWYESDLRILNAILFYFPLDRVHHITDQILDTLEKYRNYTPIRSKQLIILENLATLYLYNQQLDDCKRIINIVLQLAREEKRYDKLAFSQVRLGICTKDDSLIQKGLQILELIEDQELLNTAQEEVEQFKTE